MNRDRDIATVRHWHGLVSSAALLFERRWTLRALRRVDPGLAKRLSEQRSLFDQACITGAVDEIELQGAAMVRGWQAAVRAMGSEPDDAYMIGQDPVSGLKVAIGHQVAAADRVREVCGEQVIWLTPDECAVMLAGVEAFKIVGAVKQFFPGAEIVDRHPHTGS